MNGFVSKSFILFLGFASLLACSPGANDEPDAALFLGGANSLAGSLLGLNTSNSGVSGGCTISASATNVHPGQAVTLTLNGDAGGVERSGFTAGLSESIGDLPVTKTIIAPDSTTNYVLSVWEVDGTPVSESCDVTLTVTPAPDTGAPLPVCSLSTDKSLAAYGEEITLSWTTSDAISGQVTPTKAGGALAGAALPDGDNTFRNYYGNDFSLRVWNVDGKWADCTTTINVGVNSAATAYDAAFNLDPGAVFTGSLIAQDLEGDALAFQIKTQPTQGTVIITNPATGDYTYQANPAATGSDSFTFAANDGAQDSNTAEIRVNFTSNPACTISASSTDVFPGQPITFTIDGAGSGVERSGFSAGLGDYVGDLPATKTIIAPDASTRYAFTVWEVDGLPNGYVCEVTVNVTPAPDTGAPLPSCSLSIDKTVEVYAEEIELSWTTQNVTAAQVSPGRVGTLVAADLPAGSRNFRNYYGDTYTMRVWNADGAWAQCSANLKASAGANAAPIASDLAFSTSMDVNLAGTLSANDVENDSLTFSIKSAPANGTVVITDAATGAFTYQPNPGFKSNDSFSFAAHDGTVESNTAVVRVDVLGPPSGTIDATFGYLGMAQTQVTGGYDFVADMVKQSDGKFITLGYTSSVTNGLNYHVLTRHNADGSLDTSFGSGGKALTPHNNSYYMQGRALALQADGKILATGNMYSGSSQDFGIVRYNTDGSVDTSFGVNGRVLTHFIGHEYSLALVVQPDGKIVVGGYGTDANYQPLALVSRYNADGSLDSTFGVGGKVQLESTPTNQLWSLAVQGDGKIVAVGNINQSNIAYMAIWRLNADGVKDSSFGVGGLVKTQLGRERAQGNAVAIQADGKIIAGGEGTIGNNVDFALLRLNTDGSFDTSYGAGGVAFTDFEGSTDRISALKFQSDGKLVAVGTSYGVGYNPNFALARYDLDGSLDGGFGTGGKLTTDVNQSTDNAFALAIQADGKLVVAGTGTLSRNDTAFVLVRYNP